MRRHQEIREGMSRPYASLPAHTAQADYVVLGVPSGRLLVVIDFVGGERVALSGERVPIGMLDVLASG